MTVLQASHSYRPESTGVAEVVARVSQRLSQQGHKVHIATARPPGASQTETIDGVAIHRFRVEGNAVTGIRGEARRYAEFVTTFPADVLSVHCAQAWPLDALLPCLAKVRAAKVFVSHGFSALHNPAYDEYFGRLAQSLREMDRVVTLSSLLEEVPFCAQHGLPPPVTIPNGVDLLEIGAPPRDVRGRWGIGERPWVVSVSSHSPVKGHDALFDVVGRVRAVLPAVCGTIIGGNHPAARWGLGRLGVKGGCWYHCRLRTLGARGVELRWGVPRPEVVSAIQEADVVIVTSRREASPIVPLESMAAGTPWVSFDVGCVREYHGGMVVPTRQAMVEAVVGLLQSPEERRRLGAQGRQRAEEGHNWDVIARAYEAVYSAAAGTARGERPGPRGAQVGLPPHTR